MNIIFGAGGFAREVGWLINDLARAGDHRYLLDAFVDADDASHIGQVVGGVEILAETRFFEDNKNSDINVFIAVGSPQLKKKLYEKCSALLSSVTFPPLIHPSVLMDTRMAANRIGRGTIICAGAVLTTGVAIGDFVHINLNCTIGHDSVIGTYSTLSPGVHVSGGVVIEPSCFLGTGVALIEQIRVIAGTTIGAGATVVKNIDKRGTYLGTPAKLRERT